MLSPMHQPDMYMTVAGGQAASELGSESGLEELVDFTLSGWSPDTMVSGVPVSDRRTRRLVAAYVALGSVATVLAGVLIRSTWTEPASWPPILMLAGLALLAQHFPVPVASTSVSLGVGFLLAVCLMAGPAVGAVMVAAVFLVWSITREFLPWFGYTRRSSVPVRLSSTLFKIGMSTLAYFVAATIAFKVFDVAVPVSTVTVETVALSVVLTVGVYLLHNLASLATSLIAGDDAMAYLRMVIPIPALAEFLALPAALLLTVSEVRLGWAAFVFLGWLYLMASFLGWRSWRDRESLKQRLDELEILHSASSTLSGTLEMGELVRRLHDTVNEIVDFEQMILLLQDPSERLSQVFAYGAGGARGNPSSETLVDTEGRPEGLYSEGEEGAVFTRDLVLGEAANVRLRLDFPVGRIPSQHRVVLLDTVCQQAGVALTNARLYLQANTDRLTGVALRRYFERSLRAAAARDDSYAVIMLDLDHFKSVNDRFGHRAGDEVLRDVANVMMGTLRASDVGARWGGEEFVILLPGSGSPEAASVAERIRRTLERRKVYNEGKTITYTASFGVAASSDMGDVPDPMDVVWKADLALLEAKRAGRNQVITFGAVARSGGSPRR
jgi:diguanylate cyclase (GGDEF)-like protein